MFLVIYGVEQIYLTIRMSHHQIGLGLSGMMKFFTLGFQLITYFFHKIWRRCNGNEEGKNFLSFNSLC